jgi:hypothetical protein
MGSWKLRIESGVDIADEVADVAAAVEEGDHGLLGGFFGGVATGVDGGVPLGPEGFELLLDFGEHGGELCAGGFEVGADVGVRVHLHLFEGHVEFEGLFEQVGWGYLFLLRAGGFREIGGGSGLLFKLNALQGKKVFGAENGVAEGAVCVIELRRCGERGLLGLGRLAGEAVRMQLAGLRVKGLLECGEVQVEMLRQREEREVIGGDHGLH